MIFQQWETYMARPRNCHTSQETTTVRRSGAKSRPDSPENPHLLHSQNAKVPYCLHNSESQDATLSQANQSKTINYSSSNFHFPSTTFPSGCQRTESRQCWLFFITNFQRILCSA